MTRRNLVFLVCVGALTAGCGDSGSSAKDESRAGAGGTSATEGAKAGSGASKGGAESGSQASKGGAAANEGGSGGAASNGGAAGSKSEGGAAGESGVAQGGASGGASSAGGGTEGGATGEGSVAQGGASGGASSAGGGTEGGAAGESGVAQGGASGGASSGGQVGVGGSTTNTSRPTIGPSCNNLNNICRSCTSSGTCSSHESCCTSYTVQAGSFMMGRCTQLNCPDRYPVGSYDNELPAHTVEVGSFALDKYEVTVGRFRKFVENYDTFYANLATTLSSGKGEHPRIAGSGWDVSWNNQLPATATVLKSNLKCTTAMSKGNWTWSDDYVSDTKETYPINCVSWYEAMAFCIWDGGYLPTEAEWEYAAAGGSEERLYPWGATAPNATRSNDRDSSFSSFVSVGSHTDGRGRWQHEDLAGSMYEWTLDFYDPEWYANASASGSDVCYLNEFESNRILRGGSWFIPADAGRVAQRWYDFPYNRKPDSGFRCARTP